VKKEEITEPASDVWAYTKRYMKDVKGGVALLRK
jgi:hypothetical protein